VQHRTPGCCIRHSVLIVFTLFAALFTEARPSCAYALRCGSVRVRKGEKLEARASTTRRVAACPRPDRSPPRGEDAPFQALQVSDSSCGGRRAGNPTRA